MSLKFGEGDLARSQRAVVKNGKKEKLFDASSGSLFDSMTRKRQIALGAKEAVLKTPACASFAVRPA
jgi:hypothetical protein